MRQDYSTSHVVGTAIGGSSDSRGAHPSSGDTVWDVFESQMSRCAARTAIVDGTEEIAYERLGARALAVAEGLAAAGALPGDLVAVRLDRSWDLVATLLGVLRAGCAYVPLDPEYPEQRTRWILRHSRATAVIVEDDASVGSFAESAEVLRLSELRGGGGGGKHRRGELPRPAPADLAYVIYTSGSTGDPKGVCVAHGSVVAMAHAMGQLLDEGELAGVLAAASVCFDPSVMEILGSLMLGGTVVMAHNVLALPDLPSQSRVRTIITVPSSMRALVTAGGLPASVRCLVLGGEPLSAGLAAEVHAMPGSPRLVNVYGPTEATVFVTAGTVEPGAETVTIGRPTRAVRAYVLDEDLRPVSPNVDGELYLAGAQVAQGYLFDSGATRDCFVLPDPDGPVPEKRVYRTGDRCQWTEAGELLFRGRNDRQVKVRGHRIELDEIELALSSMPDARNAAVTVNEHRGGTLLTAYVEGASGPVAERAVRSFLGARLPRYMVPHIVMNVAAIPLLPNGKVDHRGLPRPPRLADREISEAQDRRRPGRPGPAARPRPDRTSILDVVTSEVAGMVGSRPEAIRPSVAMDSLGIDSLDAVELTVRLGHVLDADLPPTTLRECLTIHEVAEVLDRVLSASSTAGAGPDLAGLETGQTLEAVQGQFASGHPPALAAQLPAWSADDRATLVHRTRAVLSRQGFDPYGKVVRTGSAERGRVLDPHTGDERDAIIWTTNLYLGLNRDRDVLQEAQGALMRFGTGMGISAAGSGQTDLHVKFEREFAAMVGKQAACLFPTGFTASLGAVGGIVGEGDVIVMDQLCHASLVDGARLSGARVRTFRHDDVDDLRRVLASEVSAYHTTLVVVESVYSMGEGVAPLGDVVRTAKSFGALVLVDEAHSFGLYGPHGRGLCAAEGVTEEVDFVVTTLSKALGSIGGVVAAAEHHVALLRTASRPYVYQANIPPVDVAAALASLRRVREADVLRERLWDTATYMRERFTDAGFDLGPGDGLILTPHFADGEFLRSVSRNLFVRGVHTAAVAYPIVARGRGRLRFICSAAHTRADVDRTLTALVEAEAEARASVATSTSPLGAVEGGGGAPADVQTGAPIPSSTFVRALADFLRTRATTAGIAYPVVNVAVRFAEREGSAVLRVDAAGVSVGGLTHGGPACSLTLQTDEAVTALCAGDVERLMGSVITGGCVLAGQSQPFVWFLGRLEEWRRSARTTPGESTCATGHAPLTSDEDYA